MIVVDLLISCLNSMLCCLLLFILLFKLLLKFVALGGVDRLFNVVEFSITLVYLFYWFALFVYCCLTLVFDVVFAGCLT